MMRTGRWHAWFLMAFFLFAGAISGDASARDQKLRPLTPRDEYKNLPGVKKPMRDDQATRTVCTSSIERQHPTRWRNGLGYRVYRCETEIFTIESNRPPDEIDWRKRRNYYKPWIRDGF